MKIMRDGAMTLSRLNTVLPPLSTVVFYIVCLLGIDLLMLSKLTELMLFLIEKNVMALFLMYLILNIRF